MSNWQRSLDLLLEAIPPPAAPKRIDGSPIDVSLPTLPDDHSALVEAYGSGEFKYGRAGCVIEVFNPRDSWHTKLPFQQGHQILRDYRESKWGAKYLPYQIHPEIPGVLICGWNDSRDYYFWHVNGPNANKWPTVYFGDMRECHEYAMPLVVFIQKLFFGEISRRELGFAEPDFEPTGFSFRPTGRRDPDLTNRST